MYTKDSRKTFVPFVSVVVDCFESMFYTAGTILRGKRKGVKYVNRSASFIGCRMKEADEDDIGRALPKFLTQLREACVKAGGSATAHGLHK